MNKALAALAQLAVMGQLYRTEKGHDVRECTKYGKVYSYGGKCPECGNRGYKIAK